MSKNHEASLQVFGSKLFITVAAMIASLMAVLDISIVNVALSDIRASFGVQLDEIAWVSTGYMMANVIVIPLTGWFQRRFGLRNYFVFSVLLFTLASVLCALSWNLGSLTAFRILQGAGGGAIIPTASTLLMSRYPREQQGMAQAFIGLGAMTGPLLGPTLGGYLINLSSWHMIFLINIPFGLLSAYIAFKFIETPHFIPHKTPLDKKGVLLLVFGLGCLQYVLEEGNAHDWLTDGSIVIGSIVCVTCLVTLVVHMLETEEPMINLRVFMNKNYLLCTIINFFLGVSLFSASFLFSLFCGTVLNYSPLDIGLLFLKGCFIQIIMMPFIGKIMPKMDGRILTILGITVVAMSIFLNSQLDQRASNFDLIIVLFTRSIGLSCIFIPLSIISMNKIPRTDLGNAVGLFNLTRELGGSIGLAWMSTTLINRIKMFDQYLRVHLYSGNPILQDQMNILNHLFFGKVYNVNQATNSVLQNRLGVQETVQAFSLGFANLGTVFLACTLIVFLLTKINNSDPESFKVEGVH